MITKERKAEIVKQFGKNEHDTGATAVQIALITERIQLLTPHFEQHKLDHHSKRGLMKLIGKRKALLKYLRATTDDSTYNGLITALGIRK